MKKLIFLLILLLVSVCQAAITVNEITTATTAYDDPNTFLTITKPANVADSDVLLAFIMKSDNGLIDLPANWVQIVQINTTPGVDMTTLICYKVISNAGGEPADYTWTDDWGSNEGWSGGIICLTGVDNTTPSDASHTSRRIINWDGVEPCPSMTTVTDNAVVFTFFGITYGVADPTVPTDTTSAIEELNGFTPNGFSTNALVSYFTQAFAGATPAKLWALGTYSSGAEGHAYQCAMRPAPAVAPEIVVEVEQIPLWMLYQAPVVGGAQIIFININ